LLPHRLDRSHGYYTSQFLIKRALAGAELYCDENLIASEEWDLLVRLSRLCRFDYVPEVLARIHQSSDSITENYNARLTASLRILEKYRAELKKYPRALSSHYFDIALKSYLASKTVGSVRHYLLASIKAYSWYPTAYILLVSSIFGRRGIRLFLVLQKNFATRTKKWIFSQMHTGAILLASITGYRKPKSYTSQQP